MFGDTTGTDHRLPNLIGRTDAVNKKRTEKNPLSPKNGRNLKRTPPEASKVGHESLKRVCSKGEAETHLNSVPSTSTSALCRNSNSGDLSLIGSRVRQTRNSIFNGSDQFRGPTKGGIWVQQPSKTVPATSPAP
ncbi:hypothetical protein FXO37_02598 [Capsicum annuum]|nr:hypothetical protein FXO37_02598 [Capsicum annuum]